MATDSPGDRGEMPPATKKERQANGAAPEGYRAKRVSAGATAGQKLRDTPKRPKANTPGAPKGWK